MLLLLIIILGVIIVVGLFCSMFLYLQGHIPGSASFFIAFWCGLVCLIEFWTIDDYMFINYKSYTYVKPEIQLIEKTEHNVKYMIDKSSIVTYTDMGWNNPDNIYWEVRTYGTRVERVLVCNTNKGVNHE